MAISKNNLFLKGFSGKIGNVIIKQYKDKTVLSAIPDMDDRVLSEKQKQYNLFMKNANRYAKSIMADPALKEEAGRTLRVTSNQLYRALIREFILRKGEVGDLIKLK